MSLSRKAGALAVRMTRPLLRGFQAVRADQFTCVPPQLNSVVFLGDSITEGGLWSDWFPEVPTSNRGISGETTTDILTRLDSAVNRPQSVFLLAGTNDLGGGARPDSVVRNLAMILDGLRERAPHAPLYLQSVMPRKSSFSADIRVLNGLLRRLADDRTNVQFVDLWPALSNDAGALRTEYTADGLHLNGAGYAAWTDAIRPLVLAD
jgi:lysophospholipase L1-like esterase